MKNNDKQIDYTRNIDHSKQLDSRLHVYETCNSTPDLIGKDCNDEPKWINPELDY